MKQIAQDDWVDQDILTLDEAAERLRAAIREAEAEVPGLTGAARDLADRRLAAMRASLAELDAR
ncbi:hypothetical protein C7M71_000445 [Peterkaempfera bronchialis]|uniref:Programmed cell death protein 10 dimerisation domain-containing protein n=1 Tax=Peterkaempfera bronchialis TaxID=2126346 RepID=A0A345T500_9ACTN|nr:hypothetical protein C7M71_000445 [Peterkaempfera bronchialis]